MAARVDPIPKVMETVRFTSIAMSLAASWSVETARMAMPVFVRFTIKSKIPKTINVITGI